MKMWHQKLMMSSERSARVEHDSSSELQMVRREVNLALEHSEALMI